MLKFGEIRDGVLIMKDGGLRAVIKVSGLNLDLQSYDEQQRIIEQYKRFLNGLDFPIQISIHNTYLDLSDYVEMMKHHVAQIEQDTLAEYGRQYTSFLEDINMKEGLIYIKEFYIIVPYYSSEKDKDLIRKPRRQKFLDTLESADSAEKIVARYREFLHNKKFLDTRTNVIIESLKGIGIGAEVLDAEDVIEMLFKMYNPTAHKTQSETLA